MPTKEQQNPTTWKVVLKHEEQDALWLGARTP
jgi:hypothetical protein